MASRSQRIGMSAGILVGRQTILPPCFDSSSENGEFRWK